MYGSTDLAKMYDTTKQTMTIKMQDSRLKPYLIQEGQGFKLKCYPVSHVEHNPCIRSEFRPNVPIIRSDMTFILGISTTSGTGGHTSSSRDTSISRNFISVSLLLCVISKYLGAAIAEGSY